MRRLLLALLLPAAAGAQPGPLSQSGPRVGVTYLPPAVVERINEIADEGAGDAIHPAFPLVTQVGWQFEFRTFQNDAGVTGLAEFVPLLSGLERGLLLPTLTVLSGLRTPSGTEFGVGPNVALSPAEDTRGGYDLAAARPRFGLALVAGTNHRLDGFSVPVNGAVVLGEGGLRASLLLGLNTSATRY